MDENLNSFLTQSQLVESKQSTLPHKQNSFLVVLLFVLLLLSISIAGFFAYQTQNLATELKMLKNSLEMDDDTNDSGVDLYSNLYTGKNFSIDATVWKLESDVNQSPATPEVLETVLFKNNQANMNIQVGTDSLKEVLASQDGEAKEGVIVDGVLASKKSGYGGIAGSVYSTSLVLEKYGKTYLISFYTQDTQNLEEYEESFNKVVSTFKFIEQDEMENWKTYTGKIFSFRYPEDMTLKRQDIEDPENSDNIGDMVTLTGDNYNLQVSSDFIGGWGGNPCLTSKNKVVDGQNSQLLYFGKSEAGTEKCLDQYDGFVALIGNGFEHPYPILIDLQQKDNKGVELELFDQILSTFKFVD